MSEAAPSSMPEAAARLRTPPRALVDCSTDLTDILTEVEAATNGMGDAERAVALSSTFTADSTKGLNLILNEGMDTGADMPPMAPITP